ncbi:hypothetical protein DOTSEDRAFT_75947 [Dothistroma septosporum NZE10]|uniref:Uncharacterized protein n=1 Tax=Dothistroma septosporum (strain NZE10 / CBS 128990) TaxID=675120 RepID=N1PBS8_DOTSN|nr:hypothetical protein DOTSEDRAFT_75947 [Dothistroma septosporum NZE10]
MQFNTRVTSAQWQSSDRSWLVTDATGKQYTTRFLVTAMGILSQPSLPNISGVDTFKGEAWHPSQWPKDWKLDGKRVGVIGTGATAIQFIPEIAKTNLENLTVFQRRPNWSAPLRNDKISPEEMAEIKNNYPTILKQCNSSYAGFLHSADPRKTMEVPEEERIAHWEKMYNLRGFAKWLGGFSDIGTNREAAAAYSDFIANKIRGRVHDPATAEKLIPKCHLFGTRRVPLESGYFEAYNKPNVRLVDFNADSPIDRITEKGIKLESGEEIELDVLIYATGFDALTGPLTNGIDLRGVSDITPTALWKDGIRTHLGLFLHGFPNFCGVGIPHQAFGNVPRSLENTIDWVSTFLKHCKDNNITYFEAKEEEVEKWTEHVHECAQGLLANEVPSWMTGVSPNVEGKQKIIIARYSGSGPAYRKRIADVSTRGYEDLVLEK